MANAMGIPTHLPFGERCKVVHRPTEQLVKRRSEESLSRSGYLFGLARGSLIGPTHIRSSPPYSLCVCFLCFLAIPLSSDEVPSNSHSFPRSLTH